MKRGDVVYYEHKSNGSSARNGLMGVVKGPVEPDEAGPAIKVTWLLNRDPELAEITVVYEHNLKHVGHINLDHTGD